PLMASLTAIHDGVQDAKVGDPPYFWSLFSDPAHAVQQLRRGAKAVARVLSLGAAMEVIYQVRVFRWIYPLDLTVVLLLLLFLPYSLMRGPVNRIARLWMLRGTRTPT